MNKKLIAVFMLIFILMLSLVGCGSSGPSKSSQSSNSAQTQSQSANSNAKFVLKLGHVANTNQPYHEAAVKFAEMVKERTNGAVEIQIYPNSQLGGQRDLLEGLQLGTVDIVLTSTAVLSNFIPKCQVLDLPFIFRDREHVYKVVDGPLAEKIYEGAENQGMKVISTWENGFRHITNNVRPIRKPDDLKGIKIRVMENQMYIEMFKALGANPTPMAMGEVFTALQQKTVDAQENPIGQIYASRFYEVQKYLTLTGHTYSPETVVFSLKTWNKLPKEYQDVIIKAAQEARDFNRQRAEEQNQKFLEEMKAKGLQVIELTPEEKAAFQEKMKPVWAKFENVIGKDLIDAIVNTK
ncbi:MAG: TRAP transporter substrate-binding protein DctP [Thermovenabulum sp.]|uniref:TRAP transporter substrate-binding protein n=1 Tax=Thermovenabulum sp. TaxID=3100335 RepID=UPI003C79C5A0